MLAIRLEGVEQNKMISYTGAVDIKCMNEVTCFVENALENDRINKDTICTILIVIDEIVSNIYRHSGAGELSVGYERSDNKVILKFWDNGKEFNPLEYPVPDVNVPIEERKIGGLGIYLVRELMDEVFYERVNEKNYFKVVKKI